MRNISTLATFVIFMFATSRCVEAGVILGDSPAVIIQGTASMVVNITPIESREHQHSDFRQGESPGMTGSAVSLGPTLAQSANIGGREFPETQSAICGILLLANAVLPPNPVLNGLLKPC